MENINTTTQTYRNLRFRYLMDVPRSNAVFCSACEENGQERLILIFNGKGKVYDRTATREPWHELTEIEECNRIRQLLQEAIREETIPKLRSDALATV